MPAAEGGGTGVPMDKLFVGVLVLSLIFNAYLFYQNSMLGKEIDTLKSSILTSPTTATVKPATGKATTTTAASSGGKAGAASLEFYVMSKCPYGTQVLDAIAPVLKKLGKSVDFSVDYIATDNGDGKFSSLHGQTEVDEDLRELCAMKYYAADYKFMDYITCRDKSIQSTAWESCATDNGMDAAKIKACAEGSEGTKLLSDSIKASDDAGASGSPTIFVNGQSYKGGRAEADFTRALCAAMTDKPAACKNLPACSSDVECNAQPDKEGTCQNPSTPQAKCVYSEPAKFSVVVINDKRCKGCDSSRAETVTTQYFKGAVIEKMDYTDPIAKSLMSAHGIKLLPAYIFDGKVNESANWKSNPRLTSAFVLSGDKYYLAPSAVGSTFDPTAEICDNGVDDTGNGLVDCADPQCKDQMVCRKDMPKKLDVFVMSQCPYGVQALNSMKEVLDTFKGNVDFSVHYIAGYDQATGKFNSLHGQGEVDEDKRELCAMKYYPDNYKYMDYILCRNKDIKSTDWQKCATDNGMDAAKLKTCSEGDEGNNLLMGDLKIAESLEIGGSPTWLANNKYQFSGITADSIKTGYCLHNSGLAGCEKTLSADSGGVAAGGGCG
jgi:predicted DsbA family dithiol-disulfide isomerase